MSGFGDGLTELLVGAPRPGSPQVQGPQEATILDVYETTATFDLNGGKHGPHPFGRSTSPPQPGERCLVVFLGTGIEAAWIVAWTNPG